MTWESHQRNLRRGILAAVVALALLILFTPWPSDLLAWPLTQTEQPAESDAIVVLGGGTRASADPLPPQVKLRLERGVTLFHDGVAPVLLVAGGRDPRTGLVEAEVMQEFAESLQVPEPAIVQEGESRDTYQNAVNTLTIAGDNGWEHLAVVTSDYHTRRSCRIFRKLQAEILCIAAPSRNPDQDSVYERLIRFRSVVREYGAIVYFWLRGYL